MTENNGWKEWSKYVLKELERLNENYEKLTDKFTNIQTICPLGIEIKERVIKLEKINHNQDNQIKALELKFAKWTGIAIASLTCIELLFRLIK